MKFYKCKGCGKIIVVVDESKCPTKCCGEAMEEMIANTTDGAREKHVPVIEKNGNNITVSVGSVLHPMTEPHYIDFIALETTEGLQIKKLDHTGTPVANFAITDNEEVVAAYEYCNLHGFWKGTL